VLLPSWANLPGRRLQQEGQQWRHLHLCALACSMVCDSQSSEPLPRLVLHLFIAGLMGCCSGAPNQCRHWRQVRVVAISIGEHTHGPVQRPLPHYVMPPSTTPITAVTGRPASCVMHKRLTSEQLSSLQCCSLKVHRCATPRYLGKAHFSSRSVRLQCIDSWTGQTGQTCQKQ
jgi:hypothetical protein